MKTLVTFKLAKPTPSKVDALSLVVTVLNRIIGSTSFFWKEDDCVKFKYFANDDYGIVLGCVTVFMTAEQIGYISYCERDFKIKCQDWLKLYLFLKDMPIAEKLNVELIIS